MIRVRGVTLPQAASNPDVPALTRAGRFSRTENENQEPWAEDDWTN